MGRRAPPGFLGHAKAGTLRVSGEGLSSPASCPCSAPTVAWTVHWGSQEPASGKAKVRVRSQWRPRPEEEATGEPQLSKGQRPWADAPLVRDALLMSKAEVAGRLQSPSWLPASWGEAVMAGGVQGPPQP